MYWYRKIKSVLFRNGKSAVQPHWNGSRGLPEIPPQPAVSSGMLDRRAIRLRRD